MATITPKELALRLETDARTVRKFLRSDAGYDAKVGKGQRWAIEAKDVRSLKTRFNKWIAENEVKKMKQEVEAEVLAEGNED